MSSAPPVLPPTFTLVKRSTAKLCTAPPLTTVTWSWATALTVPLTVVRAPPSRTLWGSPLLSRFTRTYWPARRAVASVSMLFSYTRTPEDRVTLAVPVKSLVRVRITVPFSPVVTVEMTPPVHS